MASTGVATMMKHRLSGENMATWMSAAPYTIGDLGVVVPIGALDRQIEAFQQ